MRINIDKYPEKKVSHYYGDIRIDKGEIITIHGFMIIETIQEDYNDKYEVVWIDEDLQYNEIDEQIINEFKKR